MLNLYEKAENFVIESFSKDGILTSRGKHLINTKNSLLEICPNAEEDLIIAALLHDIDAAFIDRALSGGFKDPVYLEAHQKKSAEIAEEFVLKSGGNNDLALKVFELISKHEIGGTEKQNLLKDADSLSFFNRDLNKFLERHSDRSVNQLREKFDWMYERITSEKAKELARPMYEEAMRILENKDVER